MSSDRPFRLFDSWFRTDAETPMALAFTHRALQAIALLRLTSFDCSTENGRADERHRRALLTAVTAAAAKGISVVSLLISVPLTLGYLGPERYGMWMTIGSLIAMMTFADFGIGNGLLNAIAEAYGKDDRAAMRRHVSSAYLILGLIAVTILIGFASVYAAMPWHRLFNVESAVARNEAAPALAVFVFCFALNIPLSIVQRAQIGLQQGFTANLWQCVGSLLGLAGILVAIHMEAPLPWLVVAAVGTPMLAALANSVTFFVFRQRDLAPRLNLACAKSIRRIAHTGALFFVLQIAMAAAYLSDNLIITQTLGAAAVAQYAVPEKMFAVISTVILMAIAPLWPAYGEAIARGDQGWSSRTLIRSVQLAAITSSLLSLCLIMVGPLLLSLWIGHAVSVSFLLLAALGLWKVLDSVGNALAMYLNGRGMLRVQAILGIIMATVAVVLKIILVERLGVAGAPIATAIAYSVCVLIPLAWLIPKWLDSPSRKQLASRD